MGAIRDAANAAYADGPSGSPSQPPKSDIRALNGLIEDTIVAETAARTAADGEMIGQIDTIETRLTSVEEIAEGGVRSPLSPVDLATTANITLSGEKTIDGETTSASTVLVKDQTNPTQNGIYTTASGAWTRRADADTGEEIYLRKVLVREGSANGGTTWQCTNLTAPNIGSDAITFVQTGITDSVSVEVQTEVQNARGGFSSLEDRLDTYANVEYLAGQVVDFFDRDDLIVGHFSDTGDLVNSPGWRNTRHIAVLPGQTLRYRGAGSSLVPTFAYFNADYEWIGSEPSVGASLTDYLLTITDPDVAYVTAAARTGFDMNLHVLNPSLAATGAKYNEIRAVASALWTDYFANPDDLTHGFYRPEGTLSSSSGWRTTKPVPARTGQFFIYSGFSGGPSVASVVVLDRNLQFLETILHFPTGRSVEDFIVVVTHPDAAYVRASARGLEGDIPKFVGAASISSGGGGGEQTFEVSAFDPRVVYGLAGEPLRIYPRNLCADRSVSLALNFANSNEEFVPINNPVAGTTSIQLRARRGQAVAALFNFDLVIADTPVSPAAPLNVIVLGDSTTAQYNDDGASTNELARRLTGTGTSIADSAAAASLPWSGPAMPAPLNLSNIFFRGTLGSGPIKHEGRSAWRASTYTGSASHGSNTNAFWDPTTERFSMNYYVAQNGFGVADEPVNGIAEDGSNLLIIVALGWNDIYQDDDTDVGVAVASANLGALIDEIHSDMPNARVLVTGLNPGPRSIFKNHPAGARFVSQEEIFEVVIRAYGNGFRNVCNDRANTDFYAIAPVFDPEIAYSTANYARAFRSTDTFGGAGDHVHSRPPGYAMWADAVFYWIINQYCQG